MQETILFVSKHSPSSLEIAKFVKEIGFEAKIIRLDDDSSRKRARRSSFPVNTVPTLVVFFEDGNIQGFVGAQKIHDWLVNLLKAQAPQPEITPPPEAKKRKRRKKKETEPEIMEDDEIVEFDDEEIFLDPVDDPVPIPSTEGLKTTPKPDPKMNNIKAEAERMRKQFETSYGYNEKDLPRSS